MDKATLVKRLNWSAERASSGHYLDRLIAIAEAVELEPVELDVLRAYRAYLQAFCKPAGLDEYMLDVSRTVLHKATKLELTAEDIAPVAWGICLDALKEYGMVAARLRFSNPEYRCNQCEQE